MSDPNSIQNFLLPPFVAKPVCTTAVVGGVPVYITTPAPVFYGTPIQIVYDYAGFGILTREIPGPYQGILFNNYGTNNY